MKKIKVKYGAVGVYISGMFVVKTALDESFDVDDKVAKKLIEDGAAEYIGESETVEPAMREDETEDLSALPNSELKKIAEELGGDTSNCRSKAQLISLIEELRSEEDDELPPDFSAADPE